MVSLVSSVSLVDFLLQLYRTRYYFHIELTEETKETEETNIYPPPLPRKYFMEETKEISSVSLVSSVKIVRGGGCELWSPWSPPSPW